MFELGNLGAIWNRQELKSDPTRIQLLPRTLFLLGLPLFDFKMLIINVLSGWNHLNIHKGLQSLFQTWPV